MENCKKMCKHENEKHKKNHFRDEKFNSALIKWNKNQLKFYWVNLG